MVCSYFGFWCWQDLDRWCQNRDGCANCEIKFCDVEGKMMNDAASKSSA